MVILKYVESVPEGWNWSFIFISHRDHYQAVEFLRGLSREEAKRRLFDLNIYKNLLLKSTKSASFRLEMEMEEDRGHRFLYDPSSCLIICKIGERIHKDLVQSRRRFHRNLIVDVSHTTGVQSNTNESDKHLQFAAVNFDCITAEFKTKKINKQMR